MRSSILNCSKNPIRPWSKRKLPQFICVSVLRLSIEPRRPEQPPPPHQTHTDISTISRTWHEHCDKDSALKVRLRQISIYLFIYSFCISRKKRTGIFAQCIQTTSGGSFKCDLGIFYKCVSVQTLRSFVARAMQHNNIKASIKAAVQSARCYQRGGIEDDADNNNVWTVKLKWNFCS